MSDGPQTHDEDHSPTRQRIMTPINTLVFRHQAATSHEKVSTDTTIIIICEICDTCTGYPHDVHSLYDTVDQITPPLPSLTSSKERERASARAEREIQRERERENCIKRGGSLLLMRVVTIANVYTCICRLRCSFSASSHVAYTSLRIRLRVSSLLLILSFPRYFCQYTRIYLRSDFADAFTRCTLRMPRR